MIMSVAACLLAGCGDPVAPLQAGQAVAPGVVQASVAETPTECREVTFTITSHETVEGQWPDSTCQQGIKVIPGAPMEWRQLEDRRLRMIVRYVNLTGVPVRLPLDVMLPVEGKTPLDPHTAAAGTMVPLEYDSLGGHGETWWALAGPAGVLGVGDTSRVDTLLFQIHEPVLSARFRFNHYPVEAISDTTRPVPPSPTVFPQDSLLLVASPSGVRYRRTVFHVLFSDTTSGVTIRSFMTQFSATIIGRMGPPPGPTYPWFDYYFTIPDPGATWPVVDSLIVAMMASQGVEAARAVPRDNFFRVRGRFPVDSGLAGTRGAWFSGSASTWGLRAVHAPSAWACETGTYGGSSRMNIGFIDTFFDAANIPLDLGGSIGAGGRVRDMEGDFGVPFLSAVVDPVFYDNNFNHGVMGAGIATATGDNGAGIAGMTWNSRLVLWPMFRSPQPGVVQEPEEMLQPYVFAIQDAETQGTDVLNISFAIGVPSDLGATRNIRENMRRFLVKDPKRLIVVATGNEGVTLPLTTLASGQGSAEITATDVAAAQLSVDPQFTDRILFVSAIGRDGSKLDAGAVRANEWTGGVQIAAPGEDLVSVTHGGGIEVGSGTSLAAPYVTGLAALLWSFDPSLDGAEVGQLIRQGATAPLIDSVSGATVAKNPVPGAAGTLYLMNAYESLKLASNKPGTPICGFSAKLFGPLGSQRISVQRPGGSETISLPSQTRPYHDLSIALGGRKLAVSGFGFMEPGLSSPPAGGTAYELSLSGGSWTRRSLGELFARLYLETDTVDVWRGDGSQPPSGVGLTVTDPGFGFHATIRRNTGTVDNLRLETPLEGPVGSPNVFSFSFSPTGNDVVMDVHPGSCNCRRRGAVGASEHPFSVVGGCFGGG